MNKLPMPVICECGFNTMDATEANKHLKECRFQTQQNPPLALRYGISEELMEQIREAINIVVGGMVAGEIRSFKATIALTVLFRTFYENYNYDEETPEHIVMKIITSK